jgi:hypothetical protein
MAVDTSISPYYDDFDPTKNYNRILFKPGVPVQARELTQIQSLLQNQIKSTGDYLFTDGSRASSSPVAITINKNARSIKLQPTANDLTGYLNLYVTGATSNTIGQVKFVYDQDVPVVGDSPTLIINLISSEGDGTFLSGERLYFYISSTDAIKGNTSPVSEIATLDITNSAIATTVDVSDTVILTSSSYSVQIGDLVTGTGVADGTYVVKVNSSTEIILNQNIGVSGTNIPITFTTKNTNPCLIVTCGTGIYYKNGYFLRSKDQSIVPEKYTAYPTKSVILRYVENISTYRTDSSLLDPSFGSSNYLAPGADRLQINLTLDVVDLNNNKPNITDPYIEVVRFIDGNINFIESPADSQYAGLGALLADRTYSEAGNFSVVDFTLSSLGSTADDQNIKYSISPGEAYVGGYDVATVGKTELLVPKARTTATDLNTTVNTYYGSYVIINAPQFGLPQTHITLYDYCEVHNTTNRAAMGPSTLIGYVVPKHIQYENGYGANATFRFYWYWFGQASGTLIPEQARSVIGVSNSVSSLYGNGGTYTNPTFFATVDPTTGINALGNMIVYDTSGNTKMVFPIGKNYVKTIDNNRVTYRKVFKRISVSGSQVTISANAGEIFTGGPGTLSSAIKRQNYMFVVTSVATGTVTNGVYVPLDDVTVTLSADQTQLTVNFGGDVGSGTVDIQATMYSFSLSRRTKSLVQNHGYVANITLADTPVSLDYSDIYRLNGVFNLASNQTYIGSYNSSTVYYANNVVNYNGQVYYAIATNSNQTVTNQTYWVPISAEPALSYVLDNGQADDYYDLGKIIYVGADQYAPGSVLVVYDYFEHSGGIGAFDAQSYPASIYATIPTYTSKTDGTTVELRDCLDYRTTIRLDGSSNLIFDDNVIPDPVATIGNEVDITYYLPRIDKLYVENKNANINGSYFYLDQGIPATHPIAPINKTSKNIQLIASLGVNAYTASANDIRIIYNPFPRYTMNDVYSIDKRLSTVEKSVKQSKIEIIALNAKVFDRNGAAGNLLYNTGIIVDDFSNYGSGYIADPYFTATVDGTRQECRPAFTSVQYTLFYSSTTPSGLVVKNDLCTLNYTEENFISQTDWNEAINVNTSGIIGNAARGYVWPVAQPSTAPGGSGSSNNYTGMLVAGAAGWQVAAELNIVNYAGVDATGLITGTSLITDAAIVAGEVVIAAAAAKALTPVVNKVGQSLGIHGNISNGWGLFSDDKLKDKGDEIKDALEKLLQISTFYYKYNDIAQQMGETNKETVGVSAQTIEKIFPQALGESIDGFKTVRYDLLVPLLIASIQELNAKIESLTKE